ncbi:hypothetical protein E8E13_005402 [Curvularia kusanoi]|uniref:Heterokaryon incompatibility domain-containing protein n=1 Tax=Curvularia kusanoi TaxID=90978 RepID=A0A9P4T8V0_CURKU|nr:hypothetical protein E8E13_005402 [Curvularia kusanoi]
MRLLQIEEDGTFSLVYIIDAKNTPYAILSHTWGDSEVTYQELLDGPDVTKAGYRKIQACAEKTAERGLKHFWVDTCCIDKSSSAELSEAINTMYRWYQEAEICFAYLEGASPDLFVSKQPHTVRWFTRGWTLQELLAPREVAFFGSEWFFLGTRTEHAAALSEMTGIHAEALQRPPERSTKRRGTDFTTTYKPIPSFSIAKRMSWAAKRITTRSEDLAYCLLGLFNVNMPLLYGEGSTKAFVRLQEEIMKDSNDQSLFAWRRFCADDDPWEGYSLLAQTPSDFGDSASFVPVHYTNSDDTYSMTNKGLRITLQMVKVEQDLHIALLDCVEKSTTGQYAIVALAFRNYSGNIYGRIAIHTLRLKDLISCRYSSDTYTFPKQWPCTSQTIYVLKIYRPGLHTSTLFSSEPLEIQLPRKVYGSEFELVSSSNLFYSAELTRMHSR